MKSKALYRERNQSCIAHYQYSLLWLNYTIYVPIHIFLSLI